MGEHTGIEWADSTVNLMMGCDGCELWNPKTESGHCYAAALTKDRLEGGPQVGWPRSFGQPMMFANRLYQAAKWRDLTGTRRPAKPWLDGLPRVVFPDDMGDTFTESLPLDWLAPHLATIAESPHVWLFLTKRPRRFREFAKRYPLPPNLWAGTSITASANLGRITELLEIPAAVRFLSVEPLIEPVDLTLYPPFLAHLGAAAVECPHGHDACPICDRGIDWVICGGESGPRARAFNIAWARALRDQCAACHVPFFLKQLGGNAFEPVGASGAFAGMQLKDSKGGQMREWPADLRVRQMPRVPAFTPAGRIL